MRARNHEGGEDGMGNGEASGESKEMTMRIGRGWGDEAAETNHTGPLRPEQFEGVLPKASEKKEESIASESNSELDPTKLDSSISTPVFSSPPPPLHPSHPRFTCIGQPL